METEERILKRMKELKTKDNIERERMKELIEVEKLPFHLRIQAKGFENMLERTYDTQKDVFKEICKKDKIYKDDWKDEFCLFWAGFLKGEYSSINQYLKRMNFKSQNSELEYLR